MAKFTKLVDDGLLTGLRVEEYRPQDDLQNLAIRLAEVLNGAHRRDQDATGFNNSARGELQSAQNLQAVITELKARASAKRRAKQKAEERGEVYVPPPVRRMDPFETYDLEACQKEMETRQQRASDMLQQADDYARQARDLRAEADGLNRRIRTAQLEAKKIKRAHDAADRL